VAYRYSNGVTNNRLFQKTLLARALAGECARLKGSQKVSFYARKGADLLNRYHGESERQLREVFALVSHCVMQCITRANLQPQAKQNQPAIIFFDEIDALVPSRNSRQNQVHSSLVCTLLSLMDGIDSLQNVFVLGATNRVGKSSVVDEMWRISPW
jgi:ATPase family AAA domain-containing protein 2